MQTPSCKFIAQIIVSALAIVVCVGCGSGSSDGAGEAMDHVQYLSETIGPRPTGSENTKASQQYIQAQFESMGYGVNIQQFVFGRDASLASANIVAELPGGSQRILFVGGHYDSADVGRGAGDNASGIGVLLALASELRNVTLPFTVRFIAFGAEEVGLLGSQYYVSQLSSADVSAAIGMINLDTVATGDYLYVYGGEGDAGWIRDQALETAKALGIRLRTNPGLNPKYPAGTAGDWSDHAPFRYKGIPYAYFEATNWDIGKLDGYTQTVEYGEIYHTANDNLNFLESAFPGRVESQLSDTLAVLSNFIRTIKAPKTETRMSGRMLLITRDGREISAVEP